jgi:hypothetical protein
VGRILDQHHATSVKIQNHDTYLTISWETRNEGPQQDFLEDFDLNELRAQAKALRAGSARSPGGSTAEMLRTLGQELDSQSVDVALITEERGIYRVSGQAFGRYFRKDYSEAELLGLSARRRTDRSGGSAFSRRLGN